MEENILYLHVYDCHYHYIKYPPSPNFHFSYTEHLFVTISLYFSRFPWKDHQHLYSYKWLRMVGWGVPKQVMSQGLITAGL
jgi:hypothetical protein